MWWRPAKRIWCSECTGLGHTERRTEARTRYSDGGGGTREVPEVRDGNGRVRQMERKRRKRSRRQNMSEDTGKQGGLEEERRGERERKMLVPLLDPRHTQRGTFVHPSETKAEVREQRSKQAY